MTLVDEITRCPECGAELDRDHEFVPQGSKVVEYTKCDGSETHWWRVIDFRNDRSIRWYRISGPVSEPQAYR